MDESSPVGHVAFSREQFSPKYNHQYYGSPQGVAGEYFEARILDDNERADDGYWIELIVKRPVPGGVYRFVGQVRYLRHCAPLTLTWIVYVAYAAEGTLHQAYYYPAALGQKETGFRLGGDGPLGGRLDRSIFWIRLEEEGYVRSREIEIWSLTWQDGFVTMTLTNQLDALQGYAVAVGEVAGSIRTTLAFTDGKASPDVPDYWVAPVTWAAAHQPWSPGEELWLSIYDEETAEGLPVRVGDLPVTAEKVYRGLTA